MCGKLPAASVCLPPSPHMQSVVGLSCALQTNEFAAFREKNGPLFLFLSEMKMFRDLRQREKGKGLTYAAEFVCAAI